MSATRLAVLTAVLVALVGAAVWAVTAGDQPATAAVVPAAAAGGAGGGPPTSSPPAPSPSPGASPPAFRTLPPEVVPDTVTTDEPDFQHLLEEIHAFRAWLFEHPTYEEHLDLIYLGSCECHDMVGGALEGLTADGQHIRQDGATGVRDVVVREAGRVFAVVEASVRYPAAQLLSTSSGEVVEVDDARDWRTFLLRLIRDTDSRWKVERLLRVEDR